MTAAAAVLVALSIVACGGSSDDSQAPAGATTTASESSTTDTRTDSRSPKTSPSTTKAQDDKEPTGPTLRLDSFDSPSRNIACYIGSAGDGGARCDIRDKSWTVSRPPGCEFDYGQGLTVGPNSSRGEVVCAGDTVLGSATATLPYGSSARRGPITCISRQAGITCTNSSGHGFFISRASYRLF